MSLLLIALLLSVMQPFWGPVPVLILVCCIHVLSRFAPLVLMHTLPHVGLAAASKTLHVAGQPLDWKGLLTGALFELSASDLPQPLYAYRNFLEAQGSRSVQDA